MLIGIFGATLAWQFMISLNGGNFVDLIHSSIGGFTFGPVSVIAYLLAFAAIVVALAKACFSLIYISPDRSLKFLGHVEPSIIGSTGMHDVEDAIRTILDRR